MLQQFIKSYWSYYLELEAQFIETKRYVEFGQDNSKTYSVEYLKLYQAVCSEIDVVGKEIAKYRNPNFKTKDANIKKWGYEFQQLFGHIKDVQVSFVSEQTIHPFLNWEYEIHTDKKGRQNLRLVDGAKNVIPWWSSYNDVKHQRIGLVTGTQNFPLANQKNLVSAFSALFLMEIMFIDYLKNRESIQIEIEKSKLFSVIE
ncbi:MAG: hypothetical protein J6B01_04110 [Ruminococcus sp.]|nr:hypothetical protein [Ruminococcus sp.]